VFLLSPKFCTNLRWDSGDRELDLGELTRGCCSSRATQACSVCPVLLTGLTGAIPLWDLSRGTTVLVWCSPVFLLSSSWLVWSCFARFCEGFSFLAGCPLVVVFVPGPRGVNEASWNFTVHLLFATGLTGRVHRSNWFHRSDRQEPLV
jgi:hypothetical protein